MLSILREKKKLFLTLLFIWTIVAVWVFPRRYEILRDISLWLDPPVLNPGLSLKLQEKGDGFLNEKKEFRGVEHYLQLDKMSEACYRAMDLGKFGVDDIFRIPSWMEAEQKGWTLQKLSDSDSKSPRQGRIDPSEYWKEFSPTVLESLDYYKRALNYNPFDGYNTAPNQITFGTSRPQISGKSLLEKIRLTAFAACRPEEALLAHFQSLLSIEEMVFEKIKIRKKDPIPWWKKILNFFRFSCAADETSVSEPELPREIRIWQAITESNSSPIVFAEDYPERTSLSANQYKKLLLRTLELLRSRTGRPGSSLSPEESISLHTRMLYFSCAKRNIPPEAKYWGPSAIAVIPCDPSDEEGQKIFFSNLYRTAELYYRLGEREDSYRKRAGDLFESVYQSRKTELGMRFQSKLMRVRCLLYQNAWDQSLKELDGLQTELYTVDPEYRSDRSGYDDLIEDRKKLLQYVLRRKGRYEEADDLFDEKN
ncbi:hypothetical protein LEP1GSC058_0497 [Leptospira fainei serovar Hurstbridge str. BUT 6]|uniref:Uncharacterized protein n=1 Tax=Leptospira fainei serovar Hurstbridge str. BUT 6 TaxID=1193011 RepID=S3VH15_9LEPT|nr:hypothetical protein [Leptospira fainei]EPG75785.1 hypothetical protein LEP1GSC058_0497 [Leptospira fainei serovar Hurstbridge str. BUT 6]